MTWRILEHVPLGAWQKPKTAYNVWGNDETGEVEELPVGRTPQAKLRKTVDGEQNE